MCCGDAPCESWLFVTPFPHCSFIAGSEVSLAEKLLVASEWDGLRCTLEHSQDLLRRMTACSKLVRTNQHRAVQFFMVDDWLNAPNATIHRLLRVCEASAIVDENSVVRNFVTAVQSEAPNIHNMLLSPDTSDARLVDQKDDARLTQLLVELSINDSVLQSASAEQAYSHSSVLV